MTINKLPNKLSNMTTLNPEYSGAIRNIPEEWQTQNTSCCEI